MTPLDHLCTVPFHDCDPAQRALILRQLADTELHAALIADPAGDQAELRAFDLPGGTVALASDDAAALAAFLGGPVAHLSMPGRALAAALAGQGWGLLMNPGKPSEMLLDPAALDWLGQALSAAPQEVQGAANRLTAPHPDAVAVLAEPLGNRLADMAGRIAGAAVVGVQGRGDGQGAEHLIVVAGASGDDRPAIAKALSELLAFLPEIAGGVDVTFAELPLPAGALRIEPPPPQPAPGPAPRRSDAPPRLR